MHLPFIIAATIGWSSFANLQSSYSLMPAFRMVDRKIYPFKCAEKVVGNMPKFRSIGNWGLCSAESSRVCAQWYTCQENKISDCKSLSPEDEISLLSMQAWSRSTIVSDGNAGDPLMHRNLNLLTYKDGKAEQTGSRGVLALAHSSKTFTFFSEACYPFDQLSSTVKFSSEEAVVNALVNAEKYYEQNKVKTEGYCEDCFAKEIGSLFNIPFDSSRLKIALNAGSFRQFLFELVFYKCKKKVEARPPTFGLFPDPDDPTKEKVTTKDTAKKIFDLISELQIPLNIDGICLLKNKTTNECELHSIAASGVDKVCKTSDCNSKIAGNCKDRVQVHNSWGADWQARYTDDGFIDLESLTNQIKEPVGFGTLSWISSSSKKKK